MKQLLSLFLFLLPCLAWAQYPSNGNQKITLGEQTTADGLIFRGVAATDTVRKPSIDTMAYMVLDTTTNIMWHYKKATSNAWLRLNLLPSDTATMLTPYWRSGRFSGVLPLLNGGTGSATQNFVDLTTNQSVAGAKTFTSTITGARFDPTSSSATGNGMFLPLANTLGFSTNGQNKMTLDVNGNLGIGVTPSAWSGFKAIQLLAGTSFVGQGTQGEFWTNSYFSGNFRYYGNGRATRFACIDGTFRFFNASNNTLGADATATFVELMTLNTSGNLGINENTPTEKLHVVGNARFTAVGAGAYANDLNITSTGVLTTASSDEKYKYNILPINYGLNTILKLNPVNFQWIKGQENDLGFIAQDVAEIIPEAVDTNWNSDLLMRYESIIPILTKAIQEQTIIIKQLEERIKKLEER